MPLAPHIIKAMESSSAIRLAFEEGLKLRQQFGAENVYDFSLGNPDLEPPAEVKAAIKKSAECTEKGMHGYMPNAGYDFARNAMAEKVSGEQGVKVEGKNIVMACGAAGGLNAVFKAILSPGEEIIVPSPFFAEYTFYCANHGGKLVPVNTKDDFSLDIDAIKAALNEKTAGVLINSPNNPSGKIYSKEDICALAAALKEHQEKTGREVFLVADEPYRAITYGKTVASVFDVYKSSIVVSSFAKNLSLPGERLGYVAVNPACPNADKVVTAVVYCTRVLGYVNAPAFFQRVCAEVWNAPVDYSSYLRRRDALTANLRAAGIEYGEPEGAFYLFCKVPEGKNGSTDENDFCKCLLEQHILGVPGTGFGKRGYFRLAYCVSEQTITNSAQAWKDAVANWKK